MVRSSATISPADSLPQTKNSVLLRWTAIRKPVSGFVVSAAGPRSVNRTKWSRPSAVNSDCSAGGASTVVIDFSTANDLGPTGTCDGTTGNIGAWIEFTSPASGAFKLTNDGANNEIVIYDSCGGTEGFCSGIGPELSLSGLAPNTVY